jgi:catechol 2,3-dioxygenase-like lactoylglutathione lyase family enzyme
MRRLPRTFPTLMSADLLVLCFALSGVMIASGSPKQSGRPRITGIDHVTIYVSDVEKSRRFYSGVLGLTVGCPQYSGSETCLRVRPSEQQVLLKLVPTKIRMDAQKSWLAEITFATDEVSDLRQYLLTHGLQPGPIKEDSDGTQSFRVRDPEGNFIGFVHRSPSKIGYAPSSKQIGLRMIHVGFVVKDLAVESRF